MHHITSGIAVLTLACAAVADGPPISQWEQSWDPGNGTSSTGGLTEVTADGFVYVTTLGGQGGADADIVLLKYDSSGVLVWEQVYDGPANDADSPTDLALTDEGVSIVGASIGKTGAETVLLNYDSDGNLLNEARTFGPVFPGFLRPQLAIGADGRRVIATDDNNGSGTLQAYTAQGRLLFSQLFTFEGFSGVSALEVADDLSTFMASVQIVEGGGSGFVIRKFDPAGEELWAYETPAETGLILSDAFIVPQPDGGVIVAGSPETFCAPIIRMFRLDAAGVPQWMQDLPPGCEFLIATAMTASPDGAVYVAGSGSPSILFRVEPDGTIAWSQTHPSGFRGVDVSEDGQTVLVGATEINPQATIIDMRILRYDSKGILRWTELYTSPDDGDDFFGDISIGTGQAAMVGTSRVGDTTFQNTVVLGYSFEGCFGDVDGDGVVNVIDLVDLLAAWGPNIGHTADLNGDGIVDSVDLLALLGAWGNC